MDKLIDEMTSESFEQIGHLIVAKLKEKEPEERRLVVNKIFDAVYEPFYPIDDKLERLVGHVRDTYTDLDDGAKKTFTRQIQRHCLETQTSGLIETKTLISNIDDENNPQIANFADAPSYTIAPKWTDKNKKIGKKVRILAGMNYGTIAQVDRIEHDIVLAKLADGKIIKYLRKHVKFLE